MVLEYQVHTFLSHDAYLHSLNSQLYVQNNHLNKDTPLTMDTFGLILRNIKLTQLTINPGTVEP